MIMVIPAKIVLYSKMVRAILTVEAYLSAC